MIDLLSSEYQDVSLFQIEQLISEFWAKAICANIGATAKFYRLHPIAWAIITILYKTTFL
jgi:hypothetical protein